LGDKVANRATADLQIAVVCEVGGGNGTEVSIINLCRLEWGGGA